MAIDRKYGKVELEHSTIGEDEPVVVMRAQDELMVDVLKFYKELCRRKGSPERHLNLIEGTIATVRAWQKANFTKVPESLPLEPLSREIYEAVAESEALSR